MIKNYFKISLLFSLLLVGCKGEIVPTKEYDYSDFENYKICWNSLFFPAKTKYFAYIYSESCLHCNNIKNEVLSYIKSSAFPVYLIEYSEEIKVGENIEKTIGATTIDDVFIIGIPSLLEINNSVLTSNVAGKNSVLALLYLKK